MEVNMGLIIGPKTFYFDFDWFKYVDENLKHETQFITKAVNRTLRMKYKSRLNIHC